MSNAKLHLTVLQTSGDTQAASLADDRAEVKWNDGFTAFRVRSLRWWNDATYAAHQASDGEFPLDSAEDLDDSARRLLVANLRAGKGS